MAFPIRRLGHRTIVLGLAFLATACQGINPPPPAGEPEAPPPPIPLSFVAFPIRLSSASIQADADARLSAQPGPAGMYWTSGERISENATIQFGVHRSGPTRVEVDGDRLLLTIPIAINNGRVDVEARGPLRRARHFDFGGSGIVTFRVRLTIGSDWQLVASAEPEFRWTDRAWADVKTPVGTFKVDVANRAEPAIKKRLAETAARTEATSASRDTRGQIERLWLGLQRPIALGGQPPVTLEIEPVSISLAPLGSQGGDLMVHPTLVMKLRARLGAPGPPAPSRPLPANSGGSGGDGLSLSLRIDAPFEELNALARERVVGKTFPVKDGKAITVTGLTLSALGRKLMVRADFDAKVSRWPFGRVSGRVYFSGLPRYDDGKRQLRVDDFGYDVRTRNTLLKAGDWLLHDRFVQDLGATMVFDLSGKVDPVRRRILDGIHAHKLADGAILDATVDVFDLSDLYVDKDAISLFATVRGHARISVTR